MMYRAVTYKDILRLEPTFLSLDISVHSTGWVKSINGEVSWGTNSLETEIALDRRREFKVFMLDLFNNQPYPIVMIEDVIGGNNFKTTRGLIELNSIVDDLAADSLISIGEIKREDNNHWKKYLKQAANYEPEIKKEDPKVSIKNCLHILGFNENVPQDIYDALGMAVAVIYRDKVLKQSRATAGSLKSDLRKGYLIKQYPTDKALREQGIKLKAKLKDSREIEEVDWTGEKRDILYLFKQKVKEEERDDRIYQIKVQSSKMGVLALSKKLDTSAEIAYILIIKKK